MTVSYNKLWKRLIDLNMSKTQLREKAGITTNAIAKMRMFRQKSYVKYAKYWNVR